MVLLVESYPIILTALFSTKTRCLEVASHIKGVFAFAIRESFSTTVNAGEGRTLSFGLGAGDFEILVVGSGFLV